LVEDGLETLPFGSISSNIPLLSRSVVRYGRPPERHSYNNRVTVL
jgi:hypothetical protein